MTRRDEHAIRAEAAEIVAEAEALVGGRMLERHRWDEDLPAWILVNALAHADWRQLTELCHRTARGPGRVWGSAVLCLAEETLSAAGSPEGLRVLQLNVLLPLEMELLGDVGANPASPFEMVTLVGGRLARARGRRNHPSMWPRQDPSED